MIIEKKIIDQNGIKYLVSDIPDAHVGDIFEVITKDEYKAIKEEIGTQRQNRFFHAMINDVYKSHGWSIAGKSEAEQDAMTLADFRDWVKVEFGQGYEAYRWVGVDGKTRMTIDKPAQGQAQLVLGYIKSWSKYKKNERRDCISAFISWVEAQGISSIIEKYRGDL